MVFVCKVNTTLWQAIWLCASIACTSVSFTILRLCNYRIAQVFWVFEFGQREYLWYHEDVASWEIWSTPYLRNEVWDSISFKTNLNCRPKTIITNLISYRLPWKHLYGGVFLKYEVFAAKNRISLKLLVPLISITIGLGEECERWFREFVPELRPRLYSREHTALLDIWLLFAPCMSLHVRTQTNTHTHTDILHLLLCTHAHTYTNTPSHTSFLWKIWIAHPQDVRVDREGGVDTHKRDVTHSHVWRDSFTCVTRLIHMFGMTHPHVWLDWFTCLTRRGHLYSHVWHDSVTYVAWLIHKCGMTHSNVWHDSFTCVACLIHMCGMTHSHVWHDSFTYVA